MAEQLLHLCARATSFPGRTEKLAAACAQVTDWNALLHAADSQGIAPLVHWHLKDVPGLYPDQVRRGVRLLFLRHQHVNDLYLKILEEAVDLFCRAGVEVLVLKGAALCRTIYPEIGLRPMRDIDLLVRPEQAQQAQKILLDQGFAASTAPRPEDHFHLPSLHKKIDGLTVCIELHHGLFPDCPPYYRKKDFAGLHSRAISFTLSRTTAQTLGHEDMLGHVFNHGIRMPLAYEPLKLISVADIITLVEERFEAIDWPRLRHEYPEVYAGLPLLHNLSPWQDRVASVLSPRKSRLPAGIGETFAGWPRHRLKTLNGQSPLALLRATFWPSEWWCRLYYGVNSRWSYYRCRCLTHPRHVLWWARLQASFVEPAPANGRAMTLPQKAKRWRRTASAIVGKFFQK